MVVVVLFENVLKENLVSRIFQFVMCVVFGIPMTYFGFVFNRELTGVIKSGLYEETLLSSIIDTSLILFSIFVFLCGVFLLMGAWSIISDYIEEKRKKYNLI